MSKWVCSECNHSNNSHARYCLKCGHFKKGNVVKKATITWRCPICKEENIDHSKYCWKCGHWLLSEKYTPTKIEKGGQPSNAKPTKNTKENKISKLSIIELILIIVLGSIILIEEGSLVQALPYILVWVFMIHILFSFIYVVRAFLYSSILEGGKRLLLHAIVLFVLFIVIGYSNNQTITYTNAQMDSINSIKSSAVELEYDDLLRNANGKYKNMYVKLSGIVYHLENRNQNHIMINMSSDPFDYQAVYINRKEQDQSVILNDNVVIYGKVSGTIGTINAIGVQSSAPAIEGYSLILQNE